MTAAACAAAIGGDRTAMRPGLQRHLLPICAICSLALHASLLVLQVPTAPPRPVVRAAEGPQVLHVRLQPPSEAAAPAAPQATPAATVPAPVPPRSDAAVRAAPAPAPAAPVQAAPAPAMTQAEAVPAAVPAPPAAAGAHDGYVPRPMLSVAPVAITPVILSAPAGETTVARYVGVLSLYIDEQGQVQDAVADEATLPAAFEQAAREAFMAARFTPGQVDGRPVKSRQRVEVVFDNTPLPAH